MLKLRVTVASQHHCSSYVFSSLVTVSADMVVFIVHKNVIKMYLTFTSEEYTNMNFVSGFYKGSRGLPWWNIGDINHVAEFHS